MCDYYDHPDPVRVQPADCGYGKHLRQRNGICRRCDRYVGNDPSPNVPGWLVPEEGGEK